MRKNKQFLLARLMLFAIMLCVGISARATITVSFDPTNSTLSFSSNVTAGERLTRTVFTNWIASLTRTQRTFYDKTPPTSVIIGSNISGVDNEALSSVTTITKVTLNSSVLEFDINNGVCDIFPNATSLTFGSSMTSVPNNTIDKSNSKITSVTLSSSITKIGVRGLSGASFTTLTVPASVVTIDNFAFAECKKLESFMPEAGSNLTTINVAAFQNCTSLATVNIPAKVQTLNENGWVDGVMTEGAFPIFKGCTALKTVQIWSNYITSPASSYTTGKNLSHVFPYVETLNLFTTNNGSSTNKISPYAFYGSKTLKTVVIGGGVLEVGRYAFANSTLEKLTVNTGVSTSNPTITFNSYCFGFNSSSATLINAYIYRPFTYSVFNTGVFQGMTSLKQLVISDTQSSISVPAYTCKNCTNLENVLLYLGSATGTKNHVNGIGNEAFSNCTSLVSLTIPASVQTIADDAFFGTTKLGNVAIYSNYITNPSTAYTTSRNIAKTFFPYAKKITLGSSINGIGSYAFAVAQNATATPLATLDMSAATSLTSIPSYMCSDQTNLTSVLFPSSVKTIGSMAFLRARLQTLVLPASLTTISDKTFNNMSIDSKTGTLMSIDFSKVLSSNKLTIGESAFAASVNPSYGTLTLPTNELDIALNAFGSCPMKVNIPYSAKALKMADGAFGTSNNMVSELILDRPYTSGGQLFKKSETLPENRLQKLTLGENLTELCSDKDFTDCTNLNEITINSDVIAKKTYTNISSLRTRFPNATTVGYGANVTAIGTYSWGTNDPTNAPSLIQEVKIAENSEIATIGNYAFYNCSNLVSFDMSERTLGNLMSIHMFAFSGDEKLAGSLSIPSSVTEIRDYAFQKTGYELVSFPIDKSLVTLGSYAFYGCKAKTLYIGRPFEFKGTTSAFREMADLAELRIGGYTNIIPANSFVGSSALKTLYLDFNGYRELTTIGSKAFDACTSLPEVTIPENLQTLATDAFVNCTALKTVNMGSNYITSATTYTQTANISHCFPVVENLNFGLAVKNINNNFFYNSPSLKKVVIPSSVEELSFSAFTNSKLLADVTINSNAVMGKTYTNANNLKNCFNYVEKLTIGKDVNTIGNHAVYQSNTLKNLYFEEGSALTNINTRAFMNCTLLNNFTLPETVAALGISSFNGCSAITELTLPKSVTTMGNTAFGGCTNLEKVTCLNPIPISGGAGYFRGDSKLKIILVPFTGLKPYRDDPNDEWPTYHKNTVEGPNIRAIGYTSHDDTKAYVKADYENADELNERIYTRTYTKSTEYRNFNALYLPFTIGYKDWVKYGDMYQVKNVREYDKDQDGIIESWAVEVRRMEPSVNAATEDARNATKPNTPYLFVPKASGTIILDGVSSTLASSDPISDADAETWCASTEYRFVFNGKYTLETGNFPADTYFATTNKGVLKYSDKDSSIKPYRWYMGVYPQEGPIDDESLIKPSKFHPGVTATTGPDPVTASIYIIVEGEDEIEDAATAVFDGVKAKVVSAGTVYDLSGRKVNEADMIKGQMYIRDGVKYIYK